MIFSHFRCCCIWQCLKIVVPCGAIYNCTTTKNVIIFICRQNTITLTIWLDGPDVLGGSELRLVVRIHFYRSVITCLQDLRGGSIYHGLYLDPQINKFSCLEFSV